MSKSLKIGFHCYNFTFRGSEVALFDYALYNRKILNNISIILTPFNVNTKNNFSEIVFNKFKEFFDICFYETNEELEFICKYYNIDYVYFIKYGTKDVDNNIYIKGVKNIIHCVFTTNDEHGDIYAGVSKSVARNNNKNKEYPYVEHIVSLPDIKTNLRKDLNIPENAVVFGRHGGEDTFNIDYVKDVILDILDKYENVYFLFCVKPHILENVNHKRIKYFSQFTDQRIKRKFINSCDAMIHACNLGESFGLSILEFCFCNKPIITFNGGYLHRQHLENLGEKCLLYNDRESLKKQLEKLINKDNDIIEKIKNNYYLINKYTPEYIMNNFKNILLK